MKFINFLYLQNSNNKLFLNMLYIMKEFHLKQLQLTKKKYLVKLFTPFDHKLKQLLIPSNSKH